MVVIIDPQGAGISGNMVVGALLDLGADLEGTRKVMEHYASQFGKVSIKLKKENKGGISAIHAKISAEDQSTIKYTELSTVLNDIQHDEMPSGAIDLVLKIFKTLAEAEAKVHGTTLEDVHFHEVGAADAVADVIGASYAFYDLGLNSEKVHGLPVALGGGLKNTAHGMMSIPAPATLEILKNVPTIGGPISEELTTPTGAAIYVNVVDEFCQFQPFLNNKNIGYGAGKMDLDFPNVLRIIRASSLLPTDRVAVLETNLDNISGEILGNIFHKLMEQGALDVSMIPVLMKKNRPGHLLRVITRQQDCDILSEAIIRETGTLGVRVMPFVHRNILEREIVPVNFNLKGSNEIVHIKVGKIGNEIINATPEYEDARKISEKTQISLKRVMRLAEETFWRQFNQY
ncbi:MAG TPA: nickel pincer cofactor biosynthesis protein LarC [Methanobacteriaceae archaeon]|nr:nickel pincer cofactor biosynthesis protein LarC [Methanobacteriaceae archaeon]